MCSACPFARAGVSTTVASARSANSAARPSRSTPVAELLSGQSWGEVTLNELSRQNRPGRAFYLSGCLVYNLDAHSLGEMRL
jgi:hypothetical protein